MRKLALILALAALFAPGLSWAETPKAAPESPALGFEENLPAGSCAEEATFFAPPGGCSQTCKVDKDCRYYPEEVCLDGCCIF